MSEAARRVKSRFCVGERVIVKTDVKTPFLDGIRAHRGDTGEVVHILDSVTPAGVVVKLDKPRLSGAQRIIVTEDMIELAAPSEDASEAAQVVAAAEAITREAGGTFLQA